jgi:hypothetical protein
MQKSVGVLLYHDLHTKLLNLLEKGEKSEKIFHILLNATANANYLPQNFYYRMDLLVKIAKKSNIGFERSICAGIQKKFKEK